MAIVMVGLPDGCVIFCFVFGIFGMCGAERSEACVVAWVQL